MIRKIRAAVVAVFLLSLIAFAAYIVIDKVKADNEPPVITCEEESVSVSVEAEESELLSGVTAKDNRDGDLTDQIEIASMSNFTEPGKRTVTYAVFDSSNHAATLTRDLVYTDYTSPKIYLTEPLRYELSDSEDVSLTDHMSAQDCLDGDITSQIRASYNDSMYVSQAGDYSVTVQVSNSGGDTCSVPLTVTFTDSSDPLENDKYYPVLSDYIVYTPLSTAVDLPSFLTGLKRGGTEYLFAAGGDTLPGTAADVVISGTVDYETAGAYTVDYQFTSEDGVTAVTKLVVVVG